MQKNERHHFPKLGDVRLRALPGMALLLAFIHIQFKSVQLEANE